MKDGMTGRGPSWAELERDLHRQPPSLVSAASSMAEIEEAVANAVDTDGDGFVVDLLLRLIQFDTAFVLRSRSLISSEMAKWESSVNLRDQYEQPQRVTHALLPLLTRQEHHLVWLVDRYTDARVRLARMRRHEEQAVQRAGGQAPVLRLRQEARTAKRAVS